MFLEEAKSYLSKNILKKKKKKRLCLKRNATQAELLNKVYVEGLRLGEIEQFWRSAGSNVKDTEN